MEKSEPDKSSYVKKEKALVIAFVAFVVGFTGGIVFNSFNDNRDSLFSKSGSIRHPVQSNGPDERAGQISALIGKTNENPDDAKAWVMLGNLYFDAGRHIDAINAYKKSLELEGKNADVWTDLGVMYRRNGQPEKAVEAFDEAMRIDPKHEISRFNKGIVLLHDLNNFEAAISAWEELININPLAVAPGGRPVIELIAESQAIKNQKR